MRILITGTTYFPGMNGQAMFTANLAEGLARRGHEVLVVYPSEKGTPFRSTRNGVQLEAVKSSSLERVHEGGYFTPFPGKDVQRIFNAYQPEIMHIQDHFILSRSFALFAKKQGVKTIGTNHFMPENLAVYVPLLSKVKPLYNWVGWNWMKEVYNRLDVATAQSKAAARLIKNAGLKIPLLTVSCGIDLCRFHPLPVANRLACLQRYGLDPNRKIFLFVGRVDKEKKLDVLLHAVALLKRQDIQFAIAGRGADFDRLQALGNSLNLGDRVRFTGFVSNPDLPPLLNSVDFFTMPSEAELLSIASLEAMACGRPLLLADAVALPELVENGVNGYLFKPGSPESAAHYMGLLADLSEECWEAMGAASLAKVQPHSLESVVQQYEKIYQSLETGTILSESRK